MDILGMNVTKITNAQESDVSSDFDKPVVLIGDRLTQAYSQEAVMADAVKTGVRDRVGDAGPSNMSPEALIALQQDVSIAQTRIQLFAAVARKVTDAISTLLKS